MRRLFLHVCSIAHGLLPDRLKRERPNHHDLMCAQPALSKCTPQRHNSAVIVTPPVRHATSETADMQTPTHYQNNIWHACCQWPGNHYTFPTPHHVGRQVCSKRHSVTGTVAPGGAELLPCCMSHMLCLNNKLTQSGTDCQTVLPTLALSASQGDDHQEQSRQACAKEPRCHAAWYTCTA
jgi:hypothetical protein